MSTQPPLRMLGSGIAVVIVLCALALGTYALFRLDSWGDGTLQGDQPSQLDLAAHMNVPERLLGYTQQDRLPLTLQDPQGLAVASTGTIYVAGDQAIEVLHADDAHEVWPVDGHPTSLAVEEQADGQPGRVYVAAGHQVLVLDAAGKLQQKWPPADDKSLLTAIALGGEHVLVADAGQRVVLVYGKDGTLQTTIGRVDPERQMPGFVIPSPYFDLLAGPDGSCQVVNPGMRRVETYNLAGELQSYWGQAGSGWPDFFGCCNPVHLARTPDGHFVTAEKGIPRIKIYSSHGEFEQVVAGPSQLGVPAAALGDARGGQQMRIFDVATDASGRVLVLDQHRSEVLVFARRSAQNEVTP